MEARGKWKREAPVSLVLPSGEEVSTRKESQNELARHHFLYADETSQVEIIRNDEPYWFTVAELKFAVDSLTLNKAPGHDGISLEIVFQYNRQWLMALFNHCLRAHYFPQTWKCAVAVYFAKPDKVCSDPGSYHPICILPDLGKALDKMCATRLALFSGDQR